MGVTPLLRNGFGGGVVFRGEDQGLAAVNSFVCHLAIVAAKSTTQLNHAEAASLLQASAAA